MEDENQNKLLEVMGRSYGTVRTKSVPRPLEPNPQRKFVMVSSHGSTEFLLDHEGERMFWPCKSTKDQWIIPENLNRKQRRTWISQQRKSHT